MQLHCSLLVAVALGALRGGNQKVLSMSSMRVHASSHEMLHRTHAQQRKNNQTSDLPYVRAGATCMKVDTETVTPKEVASYDGDGGSLTLEKCYYFCVQYRSLWMLLKNGNECTCVDTFEGVIEDTCTTPCAGDSSATCGGADAEEPYLLTSWVPELVSKPCGGPSPVANVASMCEAGGGDFPSTCNISCSGGFVLEANALICDGATGEWFGHALCREVLCGLPQPIPNTLSHCTGGSMSKPDCSVECLPGFKLEKNSLKCAQANPKDAIAFFEGEALCNPVACGEAPLVEYALYSSGVNIIFPSLLEYACMVGFTGDATPTGATVFTVSCQSDGSFTELPQTCKPIDCGFAPPIDYASPVEMASVFFGSNAEYNCEEGHYVGGLATGASTTFVQCTPQGTFSEPIPCEPVSCGAPPQLPFATPSVELTAILKLNGKVDLTCDEGHGPNQHDQNVRGFTAVCGPDGQYQGLQECMPLSCGHPPTVQNALVADAEIFYGTHLMYECALGHSLDATAEGTRQFMVDCRADTTLTETQECVPVSCPTPPEVPNGKIAADAEHVFGNTLGYACDEGFSTDASMMEGAKMFTVSCLESGLWSEKKDCIEIDDCAPKNCGPFGTCVDKHLGADCVCESGYEVQDVDGEEMCGNVDDCGDCSPGTCEDLVNDYTCHCPEGFELVTDPEKACGPVLCGDPPRLDFATRPDLKVFFESTVAYSCDPGHSTDATPFGATTFVISCMASRQFSGLEACKPVECGPPHAVSFAQADKPSAVFNETVKYTCEPGHTVDATAGGENFFQVGCVAGGAYAEAAACLPVNCGSPPPLVAAAVDMQPLVYQQSATYLCEVGHSTDGTAAESALSFTAECQADGSLSGLKECAPVNCGHPAAREHALAAVENPLVFPMAVQYNCELGYTLDGLPTGEVLFSIGCGPDGDFGGDLEAVCEPVECFPIEIEHAALSTQVESVAFPGSLGYQCAHGFALETAQTEATHVSPKGAEQQFNLTCLPNAELTPPPVCKNIDDCVGQTCGAYGTCVDLIADYTCDCAEGFELNTDETGRKTCGNVDDCKDAQCGAYGVCVDFTGGYSCQCVEGYELKDLEDNHKTCAPVICGALPEVEHASNDAGDVVQLVYPMSLLYVCEHGYSTDGTAIPESREFMVSCGPTAEISLHPACHPVVCGMPMQISFAATDAPALEPVAYGSSLDYSCLPGFSTTGEPGGSETFAIECGADALFGEAPPCMPKLCGDPPAIADASWSTGVLFPGAASYECATGYSLDGTPERLTFALACQADGTFAALPADAEDGCQKISCGAPPEVPGATYDSAPRVAGESVLYTCEAGRSTTGTPAGLLEFTVACTDTGVFDAMPANDCAKILVTLSGKVTDATSNAPIAGVTLTALQGEANRVETTTDSAGIYHVQVGLGFQTKLETVREGFIGAEKNLFVEGNVAVGTVADVSVSPILPPDGWRMILTWDKKPFDLDSHIWYGAGGRSCHMFWGKRSVFCANRINAVLDVDDVNGYGPETSTLANVATSCKGGCEIKFTVRNYSRNPILENSGAIVKLYNGDQLKQEFKVGVDGSIRRHEWTVFTLDARTGQITS